jgi:hypothetical protein
MTGYEPPEYSFPNHPIIPKTTLFFDDRPLSKWQCRISGNALVFTPKEGDQPNWFNRKMQELCFGFKWVKNE